MKTHWFFMGLVSCVMIMACGCVDTEVEDNVYNELQQALAKNAELLKVLSGIAEQDAELNSKLTDLLKTDYSNIRRRMTDVETKQSLYGEEWMDCRARLDDLEKPYDPNAPELQYLLPADPNWIRDFGDNERTRKLMNVSVNRGMALRNTQVLNEVAKRLLALEALHKDPNDPNEVKE